MNAGAIGTQQVVAALSALAEHGNHLRGLVARMNPTQLLDVLEGCPFADYDDTLLDLVTWATTAAQTVLGSGAGAA